MCDNSQTFHVGLKIYIKKNIHLHRKSVSLNINLEREKIDRFLIII